MEPRQQAFTWNAGGWFGSLFGSSCWILIAGGFAATVDGVLALVNFACFGALVTAGLVLWAQRHRRDAYRSIQTLIAVTFAVTVVVLLAWDLSGHLAKIMPPQAVAWPRSVYGVLLLFPLLMFQFRTQQRNARRQSEGS
jgi:hypothetical protein